MNIPAREEIPIKSFSIAAYICQRVGKKAKYLLLRRCSPYLNNTWQMISGKIEKNETAWQAALREIKEETGIIPDVLYSADLLEQFYEVNQNCINLVPIFVAFVDPIVSVKLTSDEHDDYKWITSKQATKYLRFQNQLRAIEHIEKHFIENKPNESLRIDIQNKE